MEKTLAQKRSYKNRRHNLTVKEKSFVSEYLANKGNATKAVEKAGYNTINRNSSASLGSQLLSKPDIRAEIDSALLGLKINPQLVLERLKQLFLNGSSESTILEIAKFYFKLLGWNEERAVQESRKLIINIDASAVPQNIQRSEITVSEKDIYDSVVST